MTQLLSTMDIPVVFYVYLHLHIVFQLLVGWCFHSWFWVDFPILYMQILGSLDSTHPIAHMMGFFRKAIEVPKRLQFMCLFSKLQEQTLVWVGGFSPTHLKNMIVKMGENLPQFSEWKLKKIELPPPSRFFCHVFFRPMSLDPVKILQQKTKNESKRFTWCTWSRSISL